MPSNSYIISRLHDHEDRIEELEDAGVGTPTNEWYHRYG